MMSIIMLSVIMQSVIMLSVVMLNVVMLSVVAPTKWRVEEMTSHLSITLGTSWSNF